jgi:hypothetical protein
MKKASTIFEIIRTVFYDFNSLGLNTFINYL